MLAISVRQPYASKIISGEKPLEIRSRKIHHRGDLLICASKSARGAKDDLPRGVALGIVSVVGDRPFTKADVPLAHRPHAEGLRAWVLENPRPIEPFPIAGSAGFFYVDIDRRARRSDIPKK